MVHVAFPPASTPLYASMLIHGNRRLAVSNIGGIPETQEMLDYCGKHGVVADVEVIKANQINDAYARMGHGDVRYRVVIDGASFGDSGKRYWCGEDMQHKISGSRSAAG